tara:strand:+ start:569 stop:748 length:180 start_codon:yes stop_codon:yes gene_type:complete
MFFKWKIGPKVDYTEEWTPFENKEKSHRWKEIRDKIGEIQRRIRRRRGKFESKNRTEEN